MPADLRALVVDYGGVLTNPLTDAMGEWAAADGVDYEHFSELMREWLREGAATNPVHELESGRISIGDFERALAARLRRRDGGMVAAPGMLGRMMARFRREEGYAESMVAVVRRARGQGLRTALLSNSWGLDYPREGWSELFDAVVISGEVGMRKPDTEIFVYTARQLGLAPQQCVFVDDLPVNVRGAVAAGMVGVHHVEVGTTVEELEVLFGITLR